MTNEMIPDNISEEEIQLLDDSFYRPEPISKDSIFKFFRQILSSDDSTKTSNLTNEEIGRLLLSVRSYKELGVMCKSMGNWDKVADYMNQKAEIISSTSMGRKGFLAQLFVTQIKKEQKLQAPVEKKGWFAKKIGGESEQGS
jgi:hypothetical protein